MPDMTRIELENTIKHYIKHKDYQTAKNYLENFADTIKGFDKEEALKLIDNAEKGIKPAVKVEKDKDKEE